MSNTTNTADTITVILPCGDVGTAPRDATAEVTVVHLDRSTGRGPWIYRAEQLQIADEATAAAYHERVGAFATGRRLGFVDPVTGHR